VGVAAVQHDRPADPPRQRELAAEHRLLDGGRRQVAEEVEAHLAEGHDLRRAGARLQLGEVGLRRVGGVVRMDADGRVHAGQSAGERHRGAVRLPVGADGDHGRDPGRPGPRQHEVEVAGVLGGVEVGVRVDEAHHDACTRTLAMRGPLISTTVQASPATRTVMPGRGIVRSSWSSKPPTVW
jgi:hypothetical protein